MKTKEKEDKIAKEVFGELRDDMIKMKIKEEIESKEFPQNKLQREIYSFWRARGWSEVKAILGNMEVSFHRENPKYDCLGLEYIYLEQFWKYAQEQITQEFLKMIDSIETEIPDEDGVPVDVSVYEFIKELKQKLNEKK